MPIQRFHPLTEREQARIRRIEVQDQGNLAPWYPDEWGFQLKKQYIEITDYDADGNLNDATREVFRVRSEGDGWLGILPPEDDEEPNTPPW